VLPGSGPSGTVSFWAGAPWAARSVELGVVPIISGQGSVNSRRVPVGVDSIYALYPGDSSYSYSDATIVQTVKLAAIKMSYAGPTTVIKGKPAALSAYMRAATGPVAGRTLVFTIGQGRSAQKCSARTDAHGHALCSIGSIKQPLGKVTLVVAFAGDPRGANYDYARGQISMTLSVKS
jgi:hypothetical protein